MPIPAGLAIGMGAGLLKSQLVDKPQADRQRQLAATTAALSPWTGMTPQMPEEANPFGSMLQGGLAGAQVDQMMAKTPAPSMDAKLTTEAAETGNKPGTLIPEAGQAQKDFFAEKKKSLLSKYGPGAEYNYIG